KSKTKLYIFSTMIRKQSSSCKGKNTVFNKKKEMENIKKQLQPRFARKVKKADPSLTFREIYYVFSGDCKDVLKVQQVLKAAEKAKEAQDAAKQEIKRISHEANC